MKSVTHTRFGADAVKSTSADDFTIGTPLSVEFVQQVNVITGGYMPEYGRATGGIVNELTALIERRGKPGMIVSDNVLAWEGFAV